MITIISLLLIHAGLELDLRNVLNVLCEAGFADADWAELGLQLIDHFDLSTIRADHGQVNLCLIDTISQWLKSDPKASWEKLSVSLPKVKGYGEATADIVRKKAGIVHTGMFCLMNASFYEVQHKDKSHIFNCSYRSNNMGWKSFFIHS